MPSAPGRIKWIPGIVLAPGQGRGPQGGGRGWGARGTVRKPAAVKNNRVNMAILTPNMDLSGPRRGGVDPKRGALPTSDTVNAQMHAASGRTHLSEGCGGNTVTWC